MTTEILLVLALVVALIVGPFATLRAVTYYRARRRDGGDAPVARPDAPTGIKPGDKPDPEPGAKPADSSGDDDPDDRRGYW